MDRRLLITAAACWPATALFAQDEGQRPRHKISAGELHKALSDRFPVRFGLQGLMELQVTAPRLLLLPARNQLGASLQAQASGPALQEAPAGEVDVAFGLRYAAADQTVRARQPKVLSLRWPGLPADSVQALQSVLQAMADDAVGELVLHRFSPQELALPDTMGFAPEQLTVVDDGLLVVFGPKPRR